jgi:hypothetical protein
MEIRTNFIGKKFSDGWREQMPNVVILSRGEF